MTHKERQELLKVLSGLIGIRQHFQIFVDEMQKPMVNDEQATAAISYANKDMFQAFTAVERLIQSNAKGFKKDIPDMFK